MGSAQLKYLRAISNVTIHRSLTVDGATKLIDRDHFKRELQSAPAFLVFRKHAHRLFA